MRFRLPKSIPNSQLFKNNEELDDEDEEKEDENTKDAATNKKSTSLAAILSKAPPKFPWLFPQSNNGNGDLSNDFVKNDQQLTSSKEEEKTEEEKIRDQKKAKKIAKKNKKLEKEIRKRMIEAKKFRNTEADSNNGEILTKKQKKKRKREKEEDEKSTERFRKNIYFIIELKIVGPIKRRKPSENIKRNDHKVGVAQDLEEKKKCNLKKMYHDLVNTIIQPAIIHGLHHPDPILDVTNNEISQRAVNELIAA